MESNRIDSSTFKSFNAIVAHYLNSPVENEAWLPKTFSQTSLKKLVANKTSYPTSNRNTLVEVIKSQYQSCGIEVDSDKKLADQLKLLSLSNTYTVTTGHQLCIFTGPLYFVIKVLQTIKLAEILSKKETSNNIVPIFWLASEDHDFQEANHANLFGKTLSWLDEQGGALGAYNTQSMTSVMEDMLAILGQSDHAVILTEIFTEAYAKGLNLSEATRVLVHRLFGKKGIIVLDGNDPQLKGLFKEHMRDEILDNRMCENVTKTNELISQSFKIQVNPRKINLFYLEQNSRSRIDVSNNGFITIDGNKQWTEQEILEELDHNPERFSPNVILRPLYQEVILPNLSYVGGPGELAYWLQLKTSFNSWNVSFPGLNLRNSFFWMDQNVQKKLIKLRLSVDDLFSDEVDIKKRVINFEEHAEDIDAGFKSVSTVFENISQMVLDIDPSLKAYVLAEGRKTEKNLEQIQKKIIKAKKEKNKEALESYNKILEKLFPNGSLHERYDNFVPYFLKFGWVFFDAIYDQIDPFDNRLCVIKA